MNTLDPDDKMLRATRETQGQPMDDRTVGNSSGLGAVKEMVLVPKTPTLSMINAAVAEATASRHEPRSAEQELDAAWAAMLAAAPQGADEMTILRPEGEAAAERDRIDKELMLRATRETQGQPMDAEPVRVGPPISPLLPDSGEPEWKQILLLMRRHGIVHVPIRLRDELSNMLGWARYGERALMQRDVAASVMRDLHDRATAAEAELERMRKGSARL